MASNPQELLRDEKPPLVHDDVIGKDSVGEMARNIAERGYAATDRYGKSLLQLDPAAEARLRWKIDLHIVPTVSLLYLFCFIDRANIGNVKIAGFDKELNLKGNDYNKILSIFYISFIIFEIPCNLTCKWIGPGWFIPSATLGFGIASLCNAFVQDFRSAAGVRFLVGVFEAGMLPGIAYYLSRWYRNSELVFRLSLYVVAAPLAGAFGGLFASGILKLSHFGGLHGWRMIFAIEGIITCSLALIAFVVMTDRPATARWLTKGEKDLAIARVKSERVGTTDVLDAMNLAKIIRGLFNPVVLSVATIFFFNNITVPGLTFFAPTVVQSIYPHDSVVSQQLHTVPPYIVGAFFTVLLPFISWKLDRRTVFIMVAAPLIMGGYIMFLASTNPQVRYGGTFLIASGAFAFGALTNAQVSANVVSDSARSSAIGLNVMIGNFGGLVATWSFLSFDAPNYHIGNGLNLAASTATLIIATLLLLWMINDNKKRARKDVDAELASLSQEQIEDLDWRHPAFTWKL